MELWPVKVSGQRMDHYQDKTTGNVRAQMTIVNAMMMSKVVEQPCPVPSSSIVDENHRPCPQAQQGHHYSQNFVTYPCQVFLLEELRRILQQTHPAIYRYQSPR
jgi:hypothetical protein